MSAPNTEYTSLCSKGHNAVMHGFTTHVLAMREEERKHLANEIHDKLGQNLLALRLDVSRLHAWTQDKHPRINGRTGKLLSDLDVALRNVRDIINHLRPPVLDLGLLAAVEWKVQEFEANSKLSCFLQIDDAESEYAAYDSYAMPVIRILHEALSNIAHHARASAADIRLSCASHQLTVKISDDGIGILPEDLLKPNTYGLMGVMEYARMLNGDCVINSDGPQNGTELTVAFPSPLIS